jgi:hypothetical protein
MPPAGKGIVAVTVAESAAGSRGTPGSPGEHYHLCTTYSPGRAEKYPSMDSPQQNPDWERSTCFSRKPAKGVLELFSI